MNKTDVVVSRRLITTSYLRVPVEMSAVRGASKVDGSWRRGC